MIRLLYQLSYWLRYYWTMAVALLVLRSVCPYCFRITRSLFECPTCGVGQCEENCYPDHRDGEQCGGCEYPD